MQSPGYIYILTNPAFRETLLKIGKTTRTPEARAEELSKGTGVAMPFKVGHSRKFIDCNVAETIVHDALKRYRSNKNKEFFDVPIHVAIQAIDDLAIKDLEAQLRILESQTKSPDILLLEIISNWHNFFLTLRWPITKTPDFVYSYRVRPEFIIDTLIVDNETPFGSVETKKKLSVFIVPELPIGETESLIKTDAVLQIETLYRSDENRDEDRILLVGKSLIAGEYLGWISCYGGWEKARFTY